MTSAGQGTMERILIIGATGQLGTEFVRQALAIGHQVRALVRRSSHYAHLSRMNVEIVFGDLKDVASLRAACENMDVVVATATVVFPRGSYSFEQDEGYGYENLVRTCFERGTKQLLFVSLAAPFREPFLNLVPTVRMKFACENFLRSSGVPYTIVRPTPFMDDYFALIGSAIPLQGEPAATLNRSTGVTRLLRRVSGRTIDKLGFALVPGPATSRHAFIAVRDVASYLLRAIGHPDALNAVLEIGGPESLSWVDVCDIYAKLLGRSVRPIATKAGLLKFLSKSTRHFSEALSNQIGILWLLGTFETDLDSRHLAAQFGIQPTSAAEYLAEKMALYGAGHTGATAA